MEEPCVRQGGLCRRIEDCDQDNLVHMRGVLCPKQRHLGVECCYLLFTQYIFAFRVSKLYAHLRRKCVYARHVYKSIGRRISRPNDIRL
ncbi:hypothetical protein RR46_00448 [Papilio xuthus]|uniref:Uncharacterized protein n=1 Tax=Papilio xuthus TaxID=66420 RepID=A0A0N1PH81_PAPXU|nr:hypothetical protein RR46_00448 [Papilio xuthus]